MWCTLDTVGVMTGSLCVTAQPGCDQREYWKDAQDDDEWTREVHGATEVLECLLESGEYPTDHIHRRLLDLIIITLALALALVGHALWITLAVAYGILKTLEHVQQQQTGN
ncbi:hypothetical protein EDB89DRAFT_1911743 [Lactarius sanguifluus]|nr:hypothetical protein EDB89DRAFT_1911743 [Lactarius sanguifluus]